MPAPRAPSGPAAARLVVANGRATLCDLPTDQESRPPATSVERDGTSRLRLAARLRRQRRSALQPDRVQVALLDLVGALDQRIDVIVLGVDVAAGQPVGASAR